MKDIPIKVDGLNTIAPDEFNSFKNEWQNIIELAGLAFDENDEHQLSKAVKILTSAPDVVWFDDSGIKNSGHLNLINSNYNFPDLNSLPEGFRIRFKSNAIKGDLNVANTNTASIANSPIIPIINIYQFINMGTPYYNYFDYDVPMFYIGIVVIFSSTKKLLICPIENSIDKHNYTDKSGRISSFLTNTMEITTLIGHTFPQINNDDQNKNIIDGLLISPFNGQNMSFNKITPYMYPNGVMDIYPLKNLKNSINITDNSIYIIKDFDPNNYFKSPYQIPNIKMLKVN